MTANVSSPTDGDDIELTCATTTSGITSYEFKHGSTFLNKSASNTFTINTATVGTDDGRYSCIVYIDTVVSYVRKAFCHITSSII